MTDSEGVGASRTKGLKIFIIDIDGTICEHIDNEEGLERMRGARPYDDVIRAINELHAAGHYICFFTARTDGQEAVTREWLGEHGVSYHQLIMNKPRKLPPFAEYHFIDDAHVKATTFKGKFTRFVKKNAEIEVFAD